MYKSHPHVRRDGTLTLLVTVPCCGAKVFLFNLFPGTECLCCGATLPPYEQAPERDLSHLIGAKTSTYWS